LLAELAAYVPADAHERVMVAELVTFVRVHRECFQRGLKIGHITASAWVVNEARTHALMTHHRKLGRWLQLGGHADGDDDVRRVALREAREESGLASLRFAGSTIYDVDVHAIPAWRDEPQHLHYDVRFAFFADPTEPTRLSAESRDLAWLPIEGLADIGVDASVLRLARKTASLGWVVRLGQQSQR
jgi:8-oxo-dGTP pyrophosphatase MutT (NUDIX family)